MDDYRATPYPINLITHPAMQCGEEEPSEQFLHSLAYGYDYLIKDSTWIETNDDVK